MKYKLYLITSLYLSSSLFLIGAENQQHLLGQQTTRQRLRQCCTKPDGTRRCSLSKCLIGTGFTVASTLLLTYTILCATETLSCPTNNGTVWMGGGF
jgi:hypothetical protein